MTKRTILISVCLAVGAFGVMLKSDGGALRRMSQRISDGHTIAWARHITGQDVNDLTRWDDFNSVAVIPGGAIVRHEDEVWVVVTRTIDGNDYVNIEQFTPLDWGTDNDYAWFVDGGGTGMQYQPGASTPEVLGDYPILRAATPQADPGLTHTIALSNFADLKTYFQDPFVCAIISITNDSGNAKVTLDKPLGMIQCIANTVNYDGSYYITYHKYDDYTITINKAYVADETNTGIAWFNGCVTPGNYYLTADIDASITSTSSFLNGYGWYPAKLVGAQSGDTYTLDGCGYKITNLTQSNNRTQPGYSYVEGGFLDLYNGPRTIANLRLEDVNMYMQLGGAMSTRGSPDFFSKFYNCHVTGDIRAMGNSIYTLGGFIGYANGPAKTKQDFYDCTSAVNVDAKNYHTDTSFSYIGGFAGIAGANTRFYNCDSTGSVIAKGYGTNDAQYTGGFVGFPVLYSYFYDCSATGTVEGDQYAGGFSGGYRGEFRRCCSTGNVTANHTTNGIAGGFLGYGTSYHDTYDCYSWGNVAGGSNSRAGGFTGYLGDTFRCYSIGTVSGGSGLMGGFSGYGSGLSYSYWDTETSGLATAGPFCWATGYDTDDMHRKPNYVTWDFDTIWYMDYTVGTNVPEAWVTGPGSQLNGASVCVYADGAPRGTFTMDGNDIVDFNEADYSVVIAGLNYYSIYESFPITSSTQYGPTQTQKANITDIRLDFYETLGANIGVSLTESSEIVFSEDDWATSIEPFSGPKIVTFPRGTTREPILYLWEWQPVPLCLRGAYINANIDYP